MQAVALVNGTSLAFTVSNTDAGPCARGQAQLGGAGACFDTLIEQRCP
jgi:hypothetical protein